MTAVPCAISLQILSACTQDLSCNEDSVWLALNQSLDKLYEQSRILATADITIEEIISIDQSKHMASCKAVLRLDVINMGVKQNAEVSFPYTAELRESENVIVTIEL